jgi:hypothetical protein
VPDPVRLIDVRDRLVNIEWLRGLAYPGKVFAGVLVMASAKMATRIATDLPEINVPDDLIEAPEHDRRDPPRA